ncbi:collagen alpha-1(I) chain-like [Apus apus]|uniref:collagen alpha-1(I) chain-like n=1 Tax=Apus apus TaxID=8895 RepID=UPI0021F86C4E|nr:collagen alpha-1(I) chain-like [Apus apus]
MGALRGQPAPPLRAAPSGLAPGCGRACAGPGGRRVLRRPRSHARGRVSATLRGAPRPSRVRVSPHVPVPRPSGHQRAPPTALSEGRRAGLEPEASPAARPGPARTYLRRERPRASPRRPRLAPAAPPGFRPAQPWPRYWPPQLPIAPRQPIGVRRGLWREGARAGRLRAAAWPPLRGAGVGGGAGPGPGRLCRLRAPGHPPRAPSALPGTWRRKLAARWELASRLGPGAGAEGCCSCALAPLGRSRAERERLMAGRSLRSEEADPEWGNTHTLGQPPRDKPHRAAPAGPPPARASGEPRPAGAGRVTQGAEPAPPRRSNFHFRCGSGAGRTARPTLRSAPLRRPGTARPGSARRDPGRRPQQPPLAGSLAAPAGPCGLRAAVPPPRGGTGPRPPQRSPATVSPALGAAGPGKGREGSRYCRLLPGASAPAAGEGRAGPRCGAPVGAAALSYRGRLALGPGRRAAAREPGSRRGRAPRDRPGWWCPALAGALAGPGPPAARGERHKGGGARRPPRSLPPTVPAAASAALPARNKGGPCASFPRPAPAGPAAPLCAGSRSAPPRGLGRGTARAFGSAPAAAWGEPGRPRPGRGRAHPLVSGSPAPLFWRGRAGVPGESQVCGGAGGSAPVAAGPFTEWL